MGKRQQKPKITPEQRAALLTWIAAEYSESLIRKWFEERGWSALDPSTISYHRTRYRQQIEAARVARRSDALSTGLALKEERLKRLAEHADELEAIKWAADKQGRLWNEKAWRETLDDIAREMGHRRQGIDVVTKELEAALDRLRENLPPSEYARVLALLTQ